MLSLQRFDVSRMTRCLRCSLIWLQCALLLFGSPLPAHADGSDGSTAKVARDPSVAGSPSRGVFSATANGFTGASQLSLPIEVAPGTNGVQPELALIYSSSSTAPSWVGKGWSLSVPVIERSLKPGVPTYLPEGPFTLNGEELVPDPADPRPFLGAPTRFRTRRESYQLIDLNPFNNRFVVTQPNGTRLTFGGSDASRVLCLEESIPGTPVGVCALFATSFPKPDGSPNYPIFAWHLDTIETPDKNVVQYTYYPQGSVEGDVGRLYPREIRYTLRRSGESLTSLNGAVSPQPSVDRVVSFVLEPRADTRLSFEARFERQMTKRLARIEIKVADRIVRAYQLHYLQSDDSFASLLTAVDLLGVNGEGTPLTSRFEYTGNRPSCPDCETLWKLTDRYNGLPEGADFVAIGNTDGGLRIADMDVDGIPDLVRHLDTGLIANPNGTYLSRPKKQNSGFKYDSTLLPPRVFAASVRNPNGNVFSSSDRGTVLLDFTGDGRPDELQAVTDAFNRTITQGLDIRLEGNAFSYLNPLETTGALNDFNFAFVGRVAGNLETVIPGTFSAGGGLSVAELNGDGFPDLVQASIVRTFDARNNLVIEGVNESYAINEIGRGGLDRTPKQAFSGPRVANGPPRDRNYYICDAIRGPGFAGVNPVPDCLIDAYSSAHSRAFIPIIGGEPLGKRYYDVNGDGLDDFQSAYAAFFNGSPGRDTHLTVLNNGNAFERKPRDMFNIPFTLRFEQHSPDGAKEVSGDFVTQDRGLRLQDINGDSISDLVVAADPSTELQGKPNRQIYLGTQSPALPWRELPAGSPLQIPPDMLFTGARGVDVGVRLVDVTGDRVADLIRSDKSFRRAYFSNAVVPDLLKVATMPDGGTQTFEYSTSALQRNPDPAQDDSPKNPGLHLNLSVVSRSIVDDRKNPPVETTFEYSGGLFNRAGPTDLMDREFRGFQMVREVRAADFRITETRFHQDIERAGLVERVTVKDVFENVRIQMDMSYTADDVAGAPFVRLPEFVTMLEPAPPGSPERFTVKAIVYETDGAGVIQFGRVRAMTDFGEFNRLTSTDLDSTDNRTTEFDYVPADLNAYIVNLVSAQRLRAGTLGAGEVLRDTRFFYDGDPSGSAPRRGRLTAQIAMLNEQGKADPMTTFGYDDFGNLRSITSPRANANQRGGTTTMFVDSTFQTFMERVVNAKGHETRLTYTPDSTLCPNGPPIGLGLVYAEQGPNDTPTTRAVRCYDRFGRPTLDRAAGNLAETRTSYVDTPGAAEILAEQRASTSGGARTTRMLLDGFGRMRGMVTDGPQGDGPQGKMVATSQSLDAAGRPFSVIPPVFFPEGPGSEPTRTFYDLLDRVERVERPSAPAGSPSAPGVRRERSDFSPGVVTTTDANGNVRRRTVDPFGNVVKVEEITLNATFTTIYTFDAANNLKTVTDHAGNVTTIKYDLLGRRTLIVDPDSGTKTFEYDAGGNVLTETGPSGVLTFTYDALDRLETRKLDGLTDRTVKYDMAPLGIGLPATVTDELGAGTRTVLAYDALGRELSSRREIDGFRFDFATTYDPLGAPLRRTLPNGTVYTRLTDARGYTTGVASGTSANPTQTTQISGVQLDPAGRITRYQAANGTVTSTSFEQDTQRLSEIQILFGSTPLERRQYSFDLGDRITKITDLASANRDQSFTYDALNRLQRAQGPYAPGLAQTTLFYDYSPIGNLTCLDATATPTATTCPGGRRLVYPPAGSGTANPRMPIHAPISVNGEGATYTASGNLAQLGNRMYRYNKLEQLTQVIEGSNRTLAQYLYTSSGERIRSDDFTGPRTVTQYLLSDDFEFDATRKLARIHLPLGGATVATLTQQYVPTSTSAALAPAPAGPAVASVILLLAMLGLALQLGRLHRKGQRLARPALASALLLAFWIASVPSSVWALPLDGDLNGDGKLDGADALIALAIAQGRNPGPTPAERESGDVAPLEAAPNPPTVPDMGDALLILRAAQGDDVDSDGLGTQEELTFRSSPFKADTDDDGINDNDEMRLGMDPRNGPTGDADGDGRTDAQEMTDETDPFDPDTDGDGLPDGTDPQPLQGVRFQHGDQLGSTILITGANAIQPVIQRVAYRPYGATVAPATTPRFGFTGQRFEAGIGIYDYRARFYDPTLGRFLQPDSIVPEAGDPQSLNRYSYVRNTPLNRIDPTGNADGLIDRVLNELLGRNTPEAQVQTVLSQIEPSTPTGAVLAGLADGVVALSTAAAGSRDPRLLLGQAVDTVALEVALVTDFRGTSEKIVERVAGSPLKLLRFGTSFVPGLALGLGSVRRISSAAGTATSEVANPVPTRLARVIAGDLKPSTLGKPGDVDVFVVAAEDIAGMNSAQLAKRLTIPESTIFTLIEFDTPASGLASPIRRTNPGFVPGGRTAGGAREFVLPNGPVPRGASTRTVGP